MNDSTARHVIESLCHDLLENYLPTQTDKIVRSQKAPFAWYAEFAQSNSFLIIQQKTEPDPRPVSEYVWSHPGDVPLGEYYTLLEFDPDAIGEETTLAMLEALKDRQVYVRFSEDFSPLTPTEAIGCIRA